KKAITIVETLATWAIVKFIAKDWEYDIATQILLDQVISQSYYIFWAEIVHAIYGETKIGEHLKEVVDCIDAIVQNEHQRLSIVEQPHKVMSTPGLEIADTQGPNHHACITKSHIPSIMPPQGFTKPQQASASPKGLVIRKPSPSFAELASRWMKMVNAKTTSALPATLAKTPAINSMANKLPELPISHMPMEIKDSNSIEATSEAPIKASTPTTTTKSNRKVIEIASSFGKVLYNAL
ncbi:hypothetical protein, partial [Escherichia coli]|uniref:hypothetical protein n=1 Tax=Escherichia coli TaxID=562 RepID=UPI002577D9D2